MLDSKNNISTHLIISKSKVAPLKKVTIPRLELAAADLLAQAMSVVQKAMQLEQIPCFLWSDNTTALQWIHKPVHELKLYVANRVKSVQNLTAMRNWHHIRTADNPADLVSRGLTAKELVNNNLCWHGPSWLVEEQRKWPKPLDIQSVEFSKKAQTELRALNVLNIRLVLDEIGIFVHRFPEKSKGSRVPLIEYSRNLGELTRVLSYVLRFVGKFIAKYSKNPKHKPNSGSSDARSSSPIIVLAKKGSV